MTSIENLTYNQIFDIVMQMPVQDRKRLSEELNSMNSSTEDITLPPYTISEINDKVAEAEDDIKFGRTINAADAHRRLEEEHPWLCK